jgi:hypothetical protein
MPDIHAVFHLRSFAPQNSGVSTAGLPADPSLARALPWVPRYGILLVMNRVLSPPADARMFKPPLHTNGTTGITPPAVRQPSNIPAGIAAVNQ